MSSHTPSDEEKVEGTAADEAVDEPRQIHGYRVSSEPRSALTQPVRGTLAMLTQWI